MQAAAGFGVIGFNVPPGLVVPPAPSARRDGEVDMLHGTELS